MSPSLLNPMLAALALTQPSSPVPTPATIRTFGNWAVACDDGRRCQAVSLQPKDPDYAGVGLVVTREAGPAARTAVTLVHLFDGRHDAASIAVDGGMLAEGRLDEDCELKTGAPLAARIVDALVSGRRLRLTGNEDVSDTTLDGAAAAFRYMDAEQGRAGGVTALVARGPSAASSVPSGAIPTVPAIRVAPTSPRLPTDVRSALWKRSRCDGPIGGDAAFETHGLSGGTVLVLVSCGGDGPYNRFQDPYLIRSGSISVAPFDAPVGMGKRGAPPQIVTGGWDAKTATLTSYERGRALGDCASQETFVWDGALFRLIAKDELDACRGGMRLLPTWRARAVYRAATPDGVAIGEVADTKPPHPIGAVRTSTSLNDYAVGQLHLHRYETALVDLNGDGEPEALVYAQGPDQCGSGGCDLFVLARSGAYWRMVTDMSITRPPVRVLAEVHNGWHDLGVFVAGGGILPGHDVRLRFDGHGYPENPTVPPAAPLSGSGGRIVIAR